MECTTCLNTIDKIYIKTTESCQLNCRHCYIGDNRNKKEFFNEDKVIDWLKNNINLNNKIRVSFHGGEPFLCSLDKIRKVCDFLRGYKNITIDATTNLIYTNDRINDIISLVKEYFKNDDGTPFIKTSYDYKIRFTDYNSFLIWKENVKKIKDNKIDVEVITCLTKPLIKNISPKRYIDFIKDISPCFTFERLTENTTYDKTLIPKYEDVDDWLYECYEEYKKNPALRCWTFDDMQLAANRQFFGCRKRSCMKNVITINADGTIGGCPNSAVSQTFGSIEGSYDNNKRIELIKSEHTLHQECLYCDLLKYCNGDCCQLSWQGNICPSPQKTFRRIIYDMERT